MCVELVDALDSGIPAGRIRLSPLADRARALLAHPVAVGPSDEVVEAAARVIYGSMRFERIDSTPQWEPHGNSHAQDEARRCARSVLARWGRPAPQPVALFDIGQEWRSCVKLPITVHVRDQRPGETHSSTREGITPLRSDDLIMRGVRGEEYPIGRDLFEQTYELLPTPEATNE